MAREVFGWSSLRPGQTKAIESVLQGRDTLLVMPTGYGKSAVFNVAGALIPGPTVVVSPLIALQKDQLDALASHPRAPQAVAVNSNQSEHQNEEALDAVERGAARYLFVAPEQFANEAMVQPLARAGVRLLVVDEAHCISSWGHDFRPDYLRIGEAANALGRPTLLALTATGSPPVRDEIVERLRMRDPRILTHGFDRPNLRLDVVRAQTDAEKRAAVAEQVAQLPTPGLLYVATRRDTERYAEVLAEGGLRAAAYHAGLSAGRRREVHHAFQEDDLDVVVATNAFGMGIDKPNVRFVVHAAVPDSLESYYQEIGRAGRDGEPATITLHYRSEDLGLRTFFASGVPAAEALRDVFEALERAQQPMRIREIAASTDTSPRTVGRLVNLLDQAGVVTSSRAGIRARAGVDRDDAAERAVEVAEAGERIEQSRIAMMRSYAETRACRRHVLLAYFGEESQELCGKCDNCESGVAAEAAADAADRASGEADRAARFSPATNVRHTQWGSGTVMSVEDDRITVFFETEGYRVLSLAAIEEGDLLTVVE
ncbi:RecQ family ATP-dependent DNA helicase [Ruicaihuangia caeni]|uniref:ATP-dependent DNA helicase RecQ n=1 Tax=Ruicaihuangia caeni TaxID=3042517 RepID=A0AAW6T8A0_9MICO|nr:RecQ family ATP-dependent DNA helicase [Klugiella sp. YN-L-19]MDI2099331.1 RecQ family ATP-dependent DNA helicase [Klugiella sp. YN-L-19]